MDSGLLEGIKRSCYGLGLTNWCSTTLYLGLLLSNHIILSPLYISSSTPGKSESEWVSRNSKTAKASVGQWRERVDTKVRLRV